MNMNSLSGPRLNNEMSPEEKAAMIREKHEKRILASATGVGFDNYNEVNDETEAEFKEKYPTRAAFAEDSTAFLEMIRRNNSERKYQEYQEAMEGFMEKMYGKEEEPTKTGERESETEWLTRERLGRVGERAIRIVRMDEERGEKVGRRTGKMMLRRAQIEGAPYLDAATGEQEVLTNEMLERAELEPKFEMKLDGVRIGFSEIFKVSGKDATIGYVEKDGNVYARSYYRSGSQGVWRYLPDRTQDPKTGRVTWFGKGMGEEALTLPSEVQKFLNERGDEFRAEETRPDEMSERQRMVRKERTKAFFGTAGVARGIRFKGDGKDDALAREMDFRPKYNFEFNNEMSKSELQKYFELMPDFGEKVNDYRAKSEVYGGYEAKVFNSKNGELKWTMMEDDQGRAWVGQIETNMPVTTTGCRESWVRGGEMAMPLYEYRSQDGGYGDYDDVKGNYVSMWKNYLSKMPVIQEYKKAEAKGA